MMKIFSPAAAPRDVLGGGQALVELDGATLGVNLVHGDLRAPLGGQAVDEAPPVGGRCRPA